MSIGNAQNQAHQDAVMFGSGAYLSWVDEGGNLRYEHIRLRDLFPDFRRDYNMLREADSDGGECD